MQGRTLGRQRGQVDKFILFGRVEGLRRAIALVNLRPGLAFKLVADEPDGGHPYRKGSEQNQPDKADDNLDRQTVEVNLPQSVHMHSVCPIFAESKTPPEKS